PRPCPGRPRGHERTPTPLVPHAPGPARERGSRRPASGIEQSDEAELRGVPFRVLLGNEKKTEIEVKSMSATTEANPTNQRQARVEELESATIRLAGDS